MEEIGKALALKRKELHYTLQEVSSYLKIKEGYLHYIEKGELDKIPGKVYVKGYIKEYAKLLKLTDLDIITNLNFNYKSKQDVYTEFSKHVSHSVAVPSRIILVISILAIFCIYILYSY